MNQDAGKPRKRIPLQLLAAIDRVQGLLDTMYPWVGTANGDGDGVGQLFRETLLRVFAELLELVPGVTANGEAERIAREMAEWVECLRERSDRLAPAALDECVRCLHLLNGMLWSRICDREVEPWIATMSSMSPLRGFFRMFGNEGMGDWSLRLVLAELSNRRARLHR